MMAILTRINILLEKIHWTSFLKNMIYEKFPLAPEKASGGNWRGSKIGYAKIIAEISDRYEF